MNNNIYISPRFKNAIVLHIIKNMLSQNAVHAPLLLGIHGPSGDGKTYQCEQVLAQMRANALLLSGGQLESPNAGEPAELIRSTYINASRSVEKGEYKIAVVLINDIDTGVGNWGDMVQYTMNRQMVFSELMHLVDYPHSVGGRVTKRIPIIMTGNDFTKLYEPLVRAGRMTSFEWKPTQEEKSKIASHIFPELVSDECAELVREFHSQPVAFFSFLRSTLLDEKILREIERLGIHTIVNYISSGHEPDISLDIRLDNLIQSGKALVSSGQLINHLGRN